MMTRHIIYTALLLLMPLSMTAQDKPRGIRKALMWAKAYMDSSTVRGTDPRYIEMPEKAWTVELTSTMNHAALEMDTDWDLTGLMDGRLVTKTDNGLATSVGVALSYRSYGIGYSKIVNGKGSSFSLSTSGGNYAINAYLKSYSSDSPEASFSGRLGDEVVNERSTERIDDPIKVRTLFIDGYYLFNGKHFSYLAAYTPSLIQRRSAGSLMVGAMYYHASVDLESDNNIEMILAMQGVGKMKLTQGCIGVGYAYNWVPARGWLVSAMAMPMLTLYNRTKIYHYSFEYTGDPDAEISLDDEDGDVDIFGNMRLAGYEVENTPNRLKLNFDARLAVVYHWDSWFVRAYGQYNRFRCGHDASTGKFTDWTVFASLGMRF